MTYTSLYVKNTTDRIITFAEKIYEGQVEIQGQKLTLSFPKDVQDKVRADIVSKMYSINKDTDRGDNMVDVEFPCKNLGIHKTELKKQLDRSYTGYDYSAFFVYYFTFSINDTVIPVPALIGWVNNNPVFIFVRDAIKVGNPMDKDDLENYKVINVFEDLLPSVAKYAYSVLDDSDYTIAKILSLIPSSRYTLRDPSSANMNYSELLLKYGYNKELLNSISQGYFDNLPIVKYENGQVSELLVSDNETIYSVDYDKYLEDSKLLALVFSKSNGYTYNGVIPEQSFDVAGKRMYVDNEEWVKQPDGTFKSEFVVQAESGTYKIIKGMRFEDCYGEAEMKEMLGRSVNSLVKGFKKLGGSLSKFVKGKAMEKLLTKEIMNYHKEAMTLYTRASDNISMNEEYLDDIYESQSKNITEIFNKTYNPTNLGINKLESYYEEELDKFNNNKEEAEGKADFRKVRSLHRVIKYTESILEKIREEKRKRSQSERYMEKGI